VPAVPSLAAHTRAVFTLAVLVAPGVTRQMVAALPGPARFAFAPALVANTVRTAIQTAQGCQQNRINSLDGCLAISLTRFITIQLFFKKTTTIKTNKKNPLHNNVSISRFTF